MQVLPYISLIVKFFAQKKVRGGLVVAVEEEEEEEEEVVEVAEVNFYETKKSNYNLIRRIQ